jgi:hypothetical protein
MKVIHSFINPSHPYHIPVETLHIGIYSCLKAIELYGNCTFASNEILITKFKELELPYTDYEILDYDYNKNNFPYLSKLYSYKNQTTPFIHLDMDLILLHPLEINNDRPIKFSHRDIKSDWDFSSLDGLSASYFDPGIYSFKNYGKNFLNKLRIDQIPNMGIILCNDPEIFKLATEKVLKFYFDNQKYFDNNWSAGCFLEQALTHKFLLEDNPSYFESLFDSTAYIYNSPPLIFIKEYEESLMVDDWYNKKELNYLNFNEFLLNYNLNDLPCAHFLGASKINKYVQVFIIKKLSEMIGIEKLNKIKFYFGGGSENYLDMYKTKFLNG